MLAILCLYVFCMFLIYQSLPPNFSLIIEDLSISYAQAGLAMSAFNFPAILLMIPLTMYALRLNVRKLGMGSLTLILIGSVVVFLSRTYTVLLLGRLLIGLGFVAVPVVGLQGVSRWFKRQEMGLAMGIYSTFMILPVVISFVGFGNLGAALGWRTTIAVTILVSLIGLVVFSIFYRLPADNLEKMGRSQPVKLSAIFRMGWPIWILGLVWGLIGFAMTAIISFLPDFIYGQGFELGLAGAVTGIIMGVHVLFTAPAGYLIDRIKYKEISLVLGALVTGAVVFFLPGGISHIFLLVVVIGIGSTFFAPAVLAMTPMLVRYEVAALAFGIISMTNTLGAFGGPYVAGWIRDISGSYQYSFWFQVFIFFLVAVLSAVIWIQAKRSPRA